MAEVDENYWNESVNKSFNFDDDDIPDFPVRADKILFVEDNISESSYETGAHLQEIPLRLVISEQDLQTVIEEQSMTALPLPKNIPLEEEVKILRKQQLERLHAPSASATVSKILLGKRDVSLEMYRSLSEKEELLDEALASGNGNAILYVVLFLMRTLKKRLVYRMLQTRSPAVTHYINYLTLRGNFAEASDLLVMLGRGHEAGLLQFSTAVTQQPLVDTKKQKLKRIYADFFSQPGANSYYSHLVASYINLLEYQSAEKNLSIIDLPALETLNYICSHMKWTENSTTALDTPFKFAETYGISAMQLEWVALNEIGRRQTWRDLDVLFEKKAWHNLKAKSFIIHISLERAILQLSALNAPPPVLNQFLSHVEDAQRRLFLAKKVGAVRAMVDALVLLKDRVELESLKERLGEGTEERFYAENALKNISSSGGKWKPDISSLKIGK